MAFEVGYVCLWGEPVRTGMVINEGTGGTAVVEVDGVGWSAVFSSSDMTMLSWKAATISGTPTVGSADNSLSLDLWAGTSASSDEGSTSESLGWWTNLALILLPSQLVSEDSSKSARSCGTLRSWLTKASLAWFWTSSTLTSAVGVTGVSGIGVSVLVAVSDGQPLADVGVDVVTFAFPFPVTVEAPLTWPVLDRFGTGPNVGLYTSGSGSWSSFLSFRFCTAF